MNRQRTIVIVAPSLHQAEDFYTVTKGMYERKPIMIGFNNGALHALRGLREAIIFVLSRQYPIPDEIYASKRYNDCIIISDWR